jgi:hypothetical protein
MAGKRVNKTRINLIFGGRGFGRWIEHNSEVNCGC